MKILLTGGAGFIGSTFSKYMLEKYPDYQISALDNLETGKLSNFGQLHSNPNFQFYLGNVADEFMMEMLIEWADVIINMSSSNEPKTMNESNCAGTQTILNLLSNNPKRYIHVSDYIVYGGYSIHPNMEADLLKPQGAYAGSKAASDQLVLGYSEEYDIHATIVRLTDSYGPFLPLNHGIGAIVSNIIDDSEVTVINGNYEFTYVLDQCYFLDKVIHSNKKTKIYNMGSGHRASFSEIAFQVKKALKKDSIIRVERVVKPIQYGVASDRALMELGKLPITSLKDGLARTINWYLGLKGMKSLED